MDTEEKKPEETKVEKNVLTMSDEEFATYAKTLTLDQVKAELQKIEDSMRANGMTNEQIESYRNKAIAKIAVKSFFVERLPILLAHAVQWYLIICKVLDVMPYATWSWWAVLFPTWIDLGLSFIWYAIDKRDANTAE